LIAAGQIDDLQSHGAQGCLAAFENPLLVRAAMVQRFGDTVGDTPVPRSTKPGKSRDSAHYDKIPRSPQKPFFDPFSDGFV
jgi:hypothetical protein